MTDMVGFIDPITDLDGADQEIAGNRKGEVALYRRFEGSMDDAGVVHSGDRIADVEFGVRIVEELYGDSRKGAGFRIFEPMKQWQV